MNQYTKLAGILAAAAMLALTGCGRQEGAENSRRLPGGVRDTDRGTGGSAGGRDGSE